MNRNICDSCNYCEYKDKALLEDCIKICAYPIQTLKEIEIRRTKEDDARRLELENKLM